MLTLFTAPKAFQGHIGVIQSNAIRSWLALGADVEVLLVGADPGVAETAAEFNIRHLPDVRRAESGAPSLRSAMDEVHRIARHPTLGYVNADILLLDDFLPAIERVKRVLDRFLVVGQRWDLEVTEALSMEAGWQGRMREQIARSARRHRPVGSDFFVFPAGQYPDLPDFIIGRSGWDNWMIFDGRRRRIPVIDASEAITVVHQNHDYAHLPSGASHHRHPESARNVRLAGGREVVFRLEDADWRLSPAGPVRKRPSEYRYPRRWEADLTARLGPGRAVRILRMLLRPVDTLRSVLGFPPRRRRPKDSGPGTERAPMNSGEPS